MPLRSARALRAACAYLERRGVTAKGAEACLDALHRNGSYDLRRDAREIRRLAGSPDLAADERQAGIARHLAHARLVVGRDA